MSLIAKYFHRRDALFAIVAVVMVALYVINAGGGFPLDDSWIHQVYARNLAERGEWAFVSGQTSAASTSPLYTVLLSIGYVLHIDYQLWAHALGTTALIIAGIVSARMVEQFNPKTRDLPLITGLVIIIAWHLIWAAASGMETMIFASLTLIVMFIAWREYTVEHLTTQSLLLRGGVFGAFAALTTLARPEGIMLAGITGLLMLVAQPKGRIPPVIVWGIGATIGFMLVIAPYLLLNYQITGGLLPDTAAAKQQQNAHLLSTPYTARVLTMLLPIVAGGQIFLVPGIIYFAVMALKRDNRLQNALYAAPLVWGVGLILLYAARLPAPFQHGRYIIPALPSLILVGMLGTAGLLAWGRKATLSRIFTRVLAISAVVTFIGFALMIGPDAYHNDVRIIEEEMVAAAHWIKDNIPPDELLVIHDIGAVGYFAPRPILDIAGLVSPEVIPIVTNADALWKLMEEREGRYLMAFPDQIPGDDPTDPRLCLRFITNGKMSQRVGGPNMAVYELAWDRICQF